ncbi:lipoprotein [Mycoplasma mycoides]|uniref:Lipoprotein n=1 Tax=Mycoplasma mycoides subsp. capri TaxID=40477 RepID=A0AB38GFP1_MYCMC|nr:lipoprotein [Mycoplasma mycoides]ADH21496.1 lipoprotein [synthetic Mycoplasma mycoides JCVI-syn1.0]ACU78794.1 lipoprotein [Mycoplasma mycoides subsp. capri str. GM12]ACU79625.1 lipoprotein [Mycoplasma mycoides subsp. capri str. GM12]SRX61994.1 lipoprotein [Mycoplasma mycoides subsp. capri]SRX62438.1 lipoprotein [Mycoplasma mycoides subsp. capri]
MKKLLTIFSSISLIAMTSATAIACSNNNKKEDKQSSTTKTTDNKEKEMNKSQETTSSSANMNNTQNSNSSTTVNSTPVNSTTSMSAQPKEETFWKREPLIFSELDYVSEYFKKRESIKETSELVLSNSEGVKGWTGEPKTETPIRDDGLAETQDLILENSNSLMNSTR